MKWSFWTLLIACSGAQSTETSSEVNTEDSASVSTEPSSAQASAMNVFINELVAKSDVTDDWIELYNAGDERADLSGCTLEDSGGEPWSVPEGTEIAAGDFLLVWADDGLEGEGLHAPFKLSKDGEELILKDSQTVIIDQVQSPALEVEESYARITDGGDEWEIRSEGTPEASNN